MCRGAKVVAAGVSPLEWLGLVRPPVGPVRLSQTILTSELADWESARDRMHTAGACPFRMCARRHPE